GSQVRVLPGALLLNGGDPCTPPSSLLCARSSQLAPLRSRPYDIYPEVRDVPFATAVLPVAERSGCSHGAGFRASLGASSRSGIAERLAPRQSLPVRPEAGRQIAAGAVVPAFRIPQSRAVADARSCESVRAPVLRAAVRLAFAGARAPHGQRRLRPRAPDLPDDPRPPRAGLRADSEKREAPGAR